MFFPSMCPPSCQSICPSTCLSTLSFVVHPSTVHLFVHHISSGTPRRFSRGGTPKSTLNNAVMLYYYYIIGTTTVRLSVIYLSIVPPSSIYLFICPLFIH
ncbi:hypothetical protein AMECASPLE_020152 [Ameca splendens]|uniref:Uncharacterized protein n=1 Tax=Ameca splendens TaxID=208324 RepID=A0ABV0Y314_9TELE